MHNIHIREDGVPAAIYHKRAAWHNLGTVTEEKLTPTAAAASSGADKIIVEAVPSYDKRVDPTTGAEIFVEVPNSRNVRRTDNHVVFNVATEAYTVLQFSEVAAAADRIFEAADAFVESHAVLGKGERAFWCGKLPEPTEVMPGDIVEPYFLISTTHDGTGALWNLFTPIRVECQNLLTAAIKGAKNKVGIKHTKNVALGMELAVQQLALGTKFYERFTERLKEMAARDVSKAAVQEFLRQLFPPRKDDEGNFYVPPQTGKARAAVLANFDGAGQGATLAGSNRWGLYNAVTQYIDRDRPVHEGSDRFLDSLLNEGRAASIRQTAFDLLAVGN